jgi:GDP-L-fucose synthase
MKWCRPISPHIRGFFVTAALPDRKIWIAGHSGMVGGALMRRLQNEGCEILTAGRAALDLRDQAAVAAWMERNRPDMIVLAAARVGGILANAAQPADFLYDNMMIAANVIGQARRLRTEKLLFLGSSCIYPRMAAQPITEAALLTGALEPTNEAYAIAKIAGLKLCEAARRQDGLDFISAMPCNLYGPGDRYDEQGSHVIPALIMKMHRAKMERAPHVTLWGSGAPLREFLFADDLADALVLLLKNYSDAPPVNIGSGQEVTIAQLAALVAEAAGYKGEIRFDPARPDGAPRKLLDSSRMEALGWRAKTGLKDGLKAACSDYLSRLETRAAA